MTSKPNLFSMYNKARAAAKAGATYQGQAFETGRVNRAMGILQSKKGLQSIDPEYRSTIKYCGCPDSRKRNFICKHRIAHMLHKRILDIENPYPLTKSPSGGYLVAWQKFGAYHIIEVDTLATWELVKEQYTEGALVRPSEARGRRMYTITHDYLTETL